MARLRHKLSEGPPAPERGVRAQKHRLLLETAMTLIRTAGHVPTVAEVAQRCGVSRATAYRYFPSRSALIVAVMDATLGPVRRFASQHSDGPSRVRDVFENTFPRFREYEAQMRAAVQLSLEHWAKERAGLLEEQPFKRGFRVRIMEDAIAPMASLLPPADLLRLHQALTVIYGIETWVILKDIWGLSDRGVENIALWMADALVMAALAESSPKTSAASPAGGARTPKGNGSIGQRIASSIGRALEGPNERSVKQPGGPSAKRSSERSAVQSGGPSAKRSSVRSAKGSAKRAVKGAVC